MPLDSETKTRLYERVEEADATLSLKNRKKNKEQWAKANIEYAEALRALGDSENEPHAFMSYKKAVSAFEEALTFYKKNTDFAVWGGVKVALAKTLRNYGGRIGGQTGVLLLQRANNIIAEVYKAIPKDKIAIDHGILKLEEGYILQALAEIDLQNDREVYLRRAILAFEEAASVLRKKEQFLYWAAVLTVYGMTLSELSRLVKEEEEALAFCRKAVAILQTSCDYFQSTDNIREWAFNAIELIGAYIQLARRVEQEERSLLLQKSFLLCEEIDGKVYDILDIETKIKFQEEWAATSSMLAQISPQEEAQKLLKKALSLHQSNIDFLKEREEKLRLALAQGALGKDLCLYAQNLEGSQKNAKRLLALEALRESCIEDVKLLHPTYWLSHYMELGVVLHSLASEESGAKARTYYQEASQIYEEILPLLEQAQESALITKVQNWLGLCYTHIAETQPNEQTYSLLEKARTCFEKALALLPASSPLQERLEIENNLGDILYIMADHEDCPDKKAIFLTARARTEEILEKIQEDNMTEECLNVRLHLALILWHGAKYQQDPEEWYKAAEEGFLKILHFHEVFGNLSIEMKIKDSFARFYQDWAQNTKTAQKTSLLQKAVVLFTDIVNFSKEEALVSQAKKRRKNILDKIKSPQQKNKKWYHFWKK